MTTLAAIVKDGVFAIATDGRETNGDEISEDRRVKMFGFEPDVVIAGAGAARTLNLIERMDPEKFTVGMSGRTDAEEEPWRFGRALASAMKDDGFRRGGDKGSTSWGQGAYFMNSSGLWELVGDLSTFRVRDGWPQSMGSGSHFAVGAMEALLVADPEIEARDLVIAAVRVSISRDSYSGGSVALALRGTRDFGPEWIDDGPGGAQ